MVAAGGKSVISIADMLRFTTRVNVTGGVELSVSVRVNDCGPETSGVPPISALAGEFHRETFSPVRSIKPAGSALVDQLYGAAPPDTWIINERFAPIVRSSFEIESDGSV